MTSEQKARLTGTIVRFALYAAVGIIAIPFTIMAIKGWLLLIALACIIGGTLAVAPALDMAARNWRLKLIKDQAKRNPVETMQNIYVEKQQQLKEKAQVLNVQRTKRATYMRKLDSFKHRFPDEAEYFETAAKRMTALLRQNEEKYMVAERATEIYAGEVEKTQAIWEMGKAAEEANKGFQFTDDDFLTKIKSETAIDSAREQLDYAFSALDQSLLESQSNAPTGNPLPGPAKAAFQKALT
jgi:hypothetical protein